MAAGKFSYKYTGDTPKLFRGALIRPGDPISSDDELIMGEFEPQNAAAKAAKAATDKANDDVVAAGSAQRLAAFAGSLAVQVDDVVIASASEASSPQAISSSSAPAAPPEA